jgi:methylated-DNA-[protein]-cysteine S-methyltransferase
MMTTSFDTIETAMISTPIGALTVALRNGAACAIGFDEQWPALLRVLERRFAGARFCEAPRRDVRGPLDAIHALEAFFAGDLRAIDHVRVDAGGTPFQRSVWAQLRSITPGDTLSYAALARSIARPRAVRAVGRANALNPVSLVIPCHRVIAADGALRGYAGGLARKAWLLDHERRHAKSGARQPPISSFANTSPTGFPSHTIACSASSNGKCATPRSRANRVAVAIAG